MPGASRRSAFPGGGAGGGATGGDATGSDGASGRGDPGDRGADRGEADGGSDGDRATAPSIRADAGASGAATDGAAGDLGTASCGARVHDGAVVSIAGVATAPPIIVSGPCASATAAPSAGRGTSLPITRGGRSAGAAALARCAIRCK